MELTHKYRPTRFRDMFGQEAAVKVLLTYVKSPPVAMLLSGPSGTGKTTAARIFADRITDSCQEVDCASMESPLDYIRDIHKVARGLSLSGKPWVFILDEFHTLSRAKAAQEACLKMFEDCKTSHFILCSTAPEKIISTIRGQRCPEIVFKSVPDDDIGFLVASIEKKEKIKLPSKVFDKIIDCAGGSPRRALNLLDQVYKLKSEDAQLAAINPIETIPAAIDFVRAIARPNATWKTVAPLLKSLKGEDVEGIRNFVLAYCGSILLANNNPAMIKRAHIVIEAFREPAHYCGFAGLASMAYSVCQ